jgi:hypothetical protein
VKVLVVIVLVAVAAGAYYVYRNPTVVTPLVEGTPLESTVRDTLGTTRVYKWRDDKGVWQITDEPPPEGTKFEKLEYVNDANVVPSVPTKTTKNN